MGTTNTRGQLVPWIEVLEALPFVRRVEVREGPDSAQPAVFLHTAHGSQEYQAEIKTARPLGYAALEPLQARTRQRGKTKWLLLAPYIPTPMASYLRDSKIDYVDQAGNCHIDAAGRFFAHVEGRRLGPTTSKHFQPRTAGLQLLFVLAAKPELIDLPVRELSRLAGTGKSATAEMLTRLTEEGLLADSSSGKRILRPAGLIERWTSAYPEVRRRWLQGRYRVQDSNLENLEHHIADALSTETWAWGGTAAASRLIPHYRGSETVVHVRTATPDLPRRIRAIPDRAGPIVVLVTPPLLAFESAMPHVAHPLLVYSELLASGDERARDTATRVRERFLGAPS